MSFDFHREPLNYSKKKYLGTIFSWGWWPSHPFGTVQVCRSRVVVVFVFHAPVCAPQYRCSGVKCVLLQIRNGTLRLFTYSWVRSFNLFVSTTYPSLALQHVFIIYILCTTFLYPRLFYFLSTPLRDFSADSLKPPPIYNSTDDLLNFYFFMITYLRCSVKQWS